MSNLEVAFKFRLKGNKELSGALQLTDKQIKLLTKEFKKAGKEGDKGFKGSTKAVNSFSKSILSAKSALVGFIGVGTGVLFAKGVIDTNRELGVLKAQLRSLTGSKDGGADAFKFIEDFARETPFQIQGLTSSFVQLSNFGIDPTVETMRALTNQASKLGGSQETLTSIVKQLGQAYSKGKLQQEDIVVLAERGVPIYNLLAEATGKNTSELAEMSAKGTITKDVIDELIVVMGKFASGSNVEQINTLNGAISNLSGSFIRLQDILLSDESENYIGFLVRNSTEFIDDLSDSIENKLSFQLKELNKDIADVNSSLYTLNKRSFSPRTKGLREIKESQLRELNSRKEIIVLQQKENQLYEDENKIVAESIVIAKKQRREIEKANIESKKITDEAAKNAQRQFKLGQSAMASLQREIALRDEVSAEAIINYEITKGALKDISRLQKEQLITLSSQKDSIELAAREYEEYNAIVAEGVALAKKQRDDEASQRKGLREEFKPEEVKLERGLGDAADALDLGIINQDEFKKITDQLGKDFNASFIDPAKGGVIDLLALTDQAARNMQTQFAQFLFDPFDKGLDGMLEGFSNLIKQMAAEFAAQEIFKLIRSTASKENAASGIIGAVVNSFHDGGTVGSGGSNITVDPSVFIGAKRYHQGGFPGLKSDEVPAILQKGERVLSRKESASYKKGKGEITTINNISVSVVTSPGDNADTIGQKVAEQIARVVSKQEIAKATRPRNKLNPTTSFV